VDHFQYRANVYHAEDVSLEDIASQVGTPCYVYSRATLERHWHAFDDAFGQYPHTICYAVKSNSNLAVLNLFARLGSGFDIVSRGELERVLLAGGDARKVVFSGVGKSLGDIERAVEVGIRCFNVESVAELDRIECVARAMNRLVDVAVRINPDVDAGTHPYISTGLKENKFGIPVDEALDVYRRVVDSPSLNPSGVACHIGSQLTSMAPFEDAFTRVLEFAGRLGEEGIQLDHLDLGGGLGVRYREESPPHPTEYTNRLVACLRRHHCELPVMIEPGRVITANAGVFLTRVEYLKRTAHRQFAIVDGAMNDLLRPALYQAWQEILPVTRDDNLVEEVYDVVGPVCESADFLGKDRVLGIGPDSLLAVRSAGAYGHVMSSNYNSRPRPPEIMVDGGHCHVVRERETLEQLVAGEHLLPGMEPS
jgi:diaminopimelate decarboxylase